MSAVKRRKGFSAERELVRKLWSLGFAVIRAPASGSKVKHAIYPDVVAIKNGRVLVFEVKTRSKLETIYIRKAQVEKLKEFARRAGGEAYIAVKIKNLGWKVIPLSNLVPAGEDKFKLDSLTIKASEDLESLVNRLLNVDLKSFIKRGDQTGKLSSQLLGNSVRE